MSVYPRKDGRWGWGVTIDYDPVSGNPKRLQGICKSQKEASDKALEAASKFRQGAHVPSGRDQTLEGFLEEWITLYVKPNREPKTVSYYQGMIKHHLNPMLGRVPLRKLTPAMVQKLLVDKAKPFETESGEMRSLSPETVRGIRATLRSALTQAFRNGLVAENVAQRVSSPKQRQSTPKYFTEEQVRLFLSAASDHHLFGLFSLALLTGLRLGEITGLTWACIDLDRKIIDVRHQLQRVEGKLILKSLKTERARRKLHLTHLAVNILENERTRQAVSLESGQNDLGLVFLNPQGRPLEPKYVHTHLKAVLKKARLPEYSFHKLRHTNATLLLSQGVPLTIVRDQLGHSQIALTANTYGHAVPTALQEAAEVLERIVSRNGEAQPAE